VLLECRRPQLAAAVFMRVRRLRRLWPGSTDSLWIQAGLGLVRVLSVNRYTKHFRLSRGIIIFRSYQYFYLSCGRDTKSNK
jgi:hypothetical protein